MIWAAFFICSSIGGADLLHFAMVSSAETASTPVLVGPGTVSTDAREFATSISPAGDALYFNRIDEPEVRHIWVSNRVGEHWGDAEKMAFSDNRYSDVDPFVSRSGDRLYFSSDRPVPGTQTKEPTEDNNTWYAPLDGDNWGAPVFAGTAINSSADETFFSESATGQVIFARFGEGSGRERSTSLMTAQRNGRGFSDLRKITTSPAFLRLSNPAISPDGKLIVAAALADGNPQLYFSRQRANGEWREFQLLPAPINQPQFGQFAPYIANDGCTLYFSSNRSAYGAGGYSIFSFHLPAPTLNDR